MAGYRSLQQLMLQGAGLTVVCDANGRQEQPLSLAGADRRRREQPVQGNLRREGHGCGSALPAKRSPMRSSWASGPTTRPAPWCSIRRSSASGSGPARRSIPAACWCSAAAASPRAHRALRWHPALPAAGGSPVQQVCLHRIRETQAGPPSAEWQSLAWLTPHPAAGLLLGIGPVRSCYLPVGNRA